MFGNAKAVKLDDADIFRPKKVKPKKPDAVDKDAAKKPPSRKPIRLAKEKERRRKKNGDGEALPLKVTGKKTITVQQGLVKSGDGEKKWEQGSMTTGRKNTRLQADNKLKGECTSKTGNVRATDNGAVPAAL